MQDGIIKGTGNSRYLKSIAEFLTQYPTYQDFAVALAAGTLPVDFNGINEAGWSQLGTPLNTVNLLSAATAAKFGGGVSTVNAVLDILSKAALLNNGDLQLPDGTAVPGVKIATGSYVGTGTYGASNPCVLTFDFLPQLVIVNPQNSGKQGYAQQRAVFVYNTTRTYTAADPNGYSDFVTQYWLNKSLRWAAEYDVAANAEIQLNESGIIYCYVAVGT